MLDIILAGFIIVETFLVADAFDCGERLCRFLKYLMSLISSIAVLFYEWLGPDYKVDKYNLSDITVLFLLTTVGFYKRRVGD